MDYTINRLAYLYLREFHPCALVALYYQTQGGNYFWDGDHITFKDVGIKVIKEVNALLETQPH